MTGVTGVTVSPEGWGAKADRPPQSTPISTTATDNLLPAGNIGCLTQLAGGGVPTVHTVALLDWMAGGPRPAELGTG